MQLAGWSNGVAHVFSRHLIDYRGTCICGPLKLDGEVPSAVKPRQLRIKLGHDKAGEVQHEHVYIGRYCFANERIM